MGRNLGSNILRAMAIVGGVVILIFTVLGAGTALMPGTKIRGLFGASAEALAGNGEPEVMTLEEFKARSGAVDAGVDAGTPEVPAR